MSYNVSQCLTTTLNVSQCLLISFNVFQCLPMSFNVFQYLSMSFNVFCIEWGVLFKIILIHQPTHQPTEPFLELLPQLKIVWIIISIIPGRKVAVMKTSGKFVVCDRGNERSRMQIFTKHGHFVRKIAIRYIDIVAGLAITRDGNIGKKVIDKLIIN